MPRLSISLVSRSIPFSDSVVASSGRTADPQAHSHRQRFQPAQSLRRPCEVVQTAVRTISAQIHGLSSVVFKDRWRRRSRSRAGANDDIAPSHSIPSKYLPEGCFGCSTPKSTKTQRCQLADGLGSPKIRLPLSYGLLRRRLLIFTVGWDIEESSGLSERKALNAAAPRHVLFQDRCHPP